MISYFQGAPPKTTLSAIVDDLYYIVPIVLLLFAGLYYESPGLVFGAAAALIGFKIRSALYSARYDRTYRSIFDKYEGFIESLMAEIENLETGHSAPATDHSPPDN